MIIVTGGAGFIGSNIVKGLNKKGYKNIVIVDDLTDGHKFINLTDLEFVDYCDKDDFLKQIQNNTLGYKIDSIFHEGACSATTEWNGKFIMEVNYEYTKKLFHYAIDHKIPFIYASSAAVYGTKSDNFVEDNSFEKPVNVYGYSKYLFDKYVETYKATYGLNSPVCGFRYFNVYGYGEFHKGSMASVAYHLHLQIQSGNIIKLFEGSEGFFRDFVYIDDVVDVNIWALENGLSGVFNLGTGSSASFLKVGELVLDHYKRGELHYIDFPEHLKGHYQAYTQADMSKLREAVYQKEFTSIEDGIRQYIINLDNK
ncbi:MAG: ADP-glyceromanno-heptose 6-epimerase [Psittacicella sp.]